MRYWSDPAKEYALKLIRERHSGGVIARMVNARFGLAKTRNAIIGLAHRNGLSLKGAPVNGARAHYAKVRPQRPRKSPTEKAKAAVSPIRAIIADRLPIPPPAETDIPRVSSVDLETAHCRWVCGDPREVSPFAPLYCGEPREPGLPYCKPHVKRAYSLPESRRPTPAATAPKRLEKIEELAA